MVEISENGVLRPLKNIKMPPIIRKQGRPKGHEVTVIGLPAKKKTKKNPTVTRLQPFIELHTSVKEKAMLRWFVDSENWQSSNQKS